MIDSDTVIHLEGKQVPVVAFMGTKGGTGKTTVARTFVELVAQGRSRPNVLLVDADVYHRGMTTVISENTPVTCKSLHDYIREKDVSDAEAAYMSGEIRDAFGSPGDLYFIPASYPDSDEVFHQSAQLGASDMLRILHGVIGHAVEKYQCRCVVIDCGAIVDPYTAAAVMLADRSFIVATNEEISFQNLRNYPRSIRDFYADFKVAKMRTLFNKVRRHDLLEQRKLDRQQNVYASIPFQDAVMDGMEGVDSADALARIFLRKHVGDVVERVFRGDHEELIPDPQSMVPPQWFPVLQNAEALLRGPKMQKRRLTASFLLTLGTVLLALSVAFFCWASWDRHGAERMRDARAVALALKGEIASCDDSVRVARLREALQLAEAVRPHDPDSLANAVSAAARTGIGDVPQGARLPRTSENLAVLSIIVSAVIVVSGRVRWRQYHLAKQVLRRIMREGGVSVLDELERSSEARRGFAILRGMAE